MYHFIVNPNARSGLGMKVWREIESLLKERKVSYQSYFTKYQGHATKITEKLTAEGKRTTIIILGGDGTINEVVNGIVNFDSVVLGYIPIGSSNDFARGMHLSSDPQTAIAHILSPTKYTYLNIGTVSDDDYHRSFAISAGLGFDAQVCWDVTVSQLKIMLNKISLGKLVYLGIALKILLFQDPRAMDLTLDNKTTYHFKKVYFSAFMNQKYEGGGFQFCPKAKPGDDILDIIVVEGLSKLKILLLLPTAFFGKHTLFPGIHTYRCRKADIISEIALPVHADGENAKLHRHLSCSLEPKKIKFILS